MPMRFDIVSLFPGFVAQLAAHGVVGRAGDKLDAEALTALGARLTEHLEAAA